MNAWWLTRAALLAFAVFGVSLQPSPRLHASAAAEAARPAGSEAAAPTTVEGLMKAPGLVRPPRPAPVPDFTVPLQAGKAFRLSEQRGRVVFINFWATWCLSCREEMPTMERLWRRRRAGPFVMLAIALDANPALVAPFITGQGFTFPVAVDRKLHVADLYGVRSLPTSVIVDPQGRMVALAFGPRAWDGPVADALMNGLAP